MKSYKKDFLFLVETTLRDITNNSVKLAKAFLQKPISFKANDSLYFNILEPPRLARNLSSPLTEKRKLYNITN